MKSEENQVAEDYENWHPATQVAKATKAAAKTTHAPIPAPRYPKFDPASIPASQPSVPPAMQQANAFAKMLPCPEGFGTTEYSRNHFIPIRTGEGCARCGLDAFTILEQATTLEVTP